MNTSKFHTTVPSPIAGVAVMTGQAFKAIKITAESMKTHAALATLKDFPGILRFYDAVDGAYLFHTQEDHELLQAALSNEHIAMIYPEIDSSEYVGLRHQLAHALLRSNLDMFIYLSKVQGSFLSDLVFREETYLEHDTPLYFATCAFGAWAWNVPPGHVYFTVCDQFRKTPHHGYLVKKEAYQALRENRGIPIPHERLQEFSPDLNMPMYVPDEIDANTYYMVSAKETDHEISILAYNYTEKRHKQITLNSVTYQQQGNPQSFRFENDYLTGAISYYAQVKDVNPYQEQEAA